MCESLFGEILVEMGLLTDEQVKQVLEVQKTTQQKFGQIVIRLGLATADQVWEAWARQMSYRRRFVEPMEVGIDTAAVLRVTIPTARALRVVPLRLWGDNLVVAGAPDLDAGTVSTLTERTCCKVYACMAYPESIQYYLDRLEQFAQPGELSEPPALVCG
jgi:type IV pilus assembly protein PilB